MSNFIVRAVRFYKEVKAETIKVSWPSIKEVALVSSFVIVAAAVTGLILLCIDSLLYKCIKVFLGIGG